MKVIFNSVLPPGKDFSAINIFGFLFVKRGVRVTAQLLNHERIHTAQIIECGYIFFYLFYVAEWIYRLFRNHFRSYQAYRAISFEKEAYDHEDDPAYLLTRPHFSMWRKKHVISH